MIRLLKPLSFLPAICLMYMIFTFSAQDGVASSQLSYKVSHKVVEVGGEILGADFEPWEIDSLATRFHGVIRKIAHMTEYFALAVAVAFPLYVYGLRGILLMIVAGAFCVAFACGDEYHQSYVAGRGPSRRDVLIDSFGVFWGIVLVRIIGWTGRKTIFRPFGKMKKEKNQARPEQAYSGQPYPGAVPYQAGAAPYQAGAAPYQPGTAPYQPGTAPYQPGAAPYQQGAAPCHTGQAPYHGQAAPSRQTVYGASDPAGRGYVNAPSYYPPRESIQNGPFPPQGYGYPARGDLAGGPYTDDSHTTSDRLSEDMSFRKLVHDLKEQKADNKKQKRQD